MKRTKLTLIPIEEFSGIEKDSMIYVLGGKSSAGKQKCGMFLKCETFTCVEFSCGIFYCGSYTRISKKEAADSMKD